MLAFIVFDHLKCLTPDGQRMWGAEDKDDGIERSGTRRGDSRVHDIPMCDGRLRSNLIQTDLILTLQQ